MKILFASSNIIALPSLEALCLQYDVRAVLTAVDKPVGRKRIMTANPIAQYAVTHGIRLLQPHTLGVDARCMVRECDVDILVCFAYGKIFGPKFLNLFSYGGINVHPSLLPLHRGPSPIQAAILARDAYTGICIQRIAREMDCGDILASLSFALHEQSTTESVSAYVAHQAPQLLLKTVDDIAHYREHSYPQCHGNATFCHLIQKDDGLIQWHHSAFYIDCMLRAYTPWPGVYTTWKDMRILLLAGYPLTIEHAPISTEVKNMEKKYGAVLNIHQQYGIIIATGFGVFVITRLQIQGKKPLSWRDFVNGHSALHEAILGE